MSPMAPGKAVSLHNLYMEIWFVAFANLEAGITIQSRTDGGIFNLRSTGQLAR